MAVYWRLIYPGSGMLRTMWLEAARARVEKARIPIGSEALTR